MHVSSPKACTLTAASSVCTFLPARAKRPPISSQTAVLSARSPDVRGIVRLCSSEHGCLLLREASLRSVCNCRKAKNAFRVRASCASAMAAPARPGLESCVKQSRPGSSGRSLMALERCKVLICLSVAMAICLLVCCITMLRLWRSKVGTGWPFESAVIAGSASINLSRTSCDACCGCSTSRNLAQRASTYRLRFLVVGVCA